MIKIKRGIKMRVNPEQNRKVQEICFENGIDWSFGGKQIRHDTEPYLFVENTISFMYEVEEEDFLNDLNEEVSAELFIRTNGTCVESEAPTEDNNKGEQMAELKLECLVEGYEGTYFEIGQVWETRGGERLKVKRFDFKTDNYKLIMSEIEDLNLVRYYSSKGRDVHGRESDFDLVKLISTEGTTETTPTKQSQPKTLSEYLKENNAYESFVENCVARALLNPKSYKYKRGTALGIDEFFTWDKTKEGQIYWYTLHSNIPKHFIYDMNEIVFAEVDRRIAEQKAQPKFISTEEFDQMLEQKSSTKYMVFVEGKNTPRYVHEIKDSAETEAKRLSTKLVGSKVFVVEIVKTFKSKVIVEEIK